MSDAKATRERFLDLKKRLENEMAEMSQINIEEIVRKYSEKEMVRLMKVIMENNVTMLKLQKQIVELQVTAKEKKRRQEDREQRRREYKERKEEEKQRRQKEKEEETERKRVDEEWKRVEEMRIQEERRAEKEWRQQEMWERRREENKQRAIEERKCFTCRGFGHMAYSCKNVGVEGPAQLPLNKFEVLKDRVMQKGEEGGGEVRKDRKEILKEEKAKRGVEVKQTKIEKKEKKEKYLREVTVKIGLKQEEEEEGMVVDTLLDSGATELVMSKEFARKHRFKRTKLERPIYVRNVDGTLNCVGPIRDTVEVEIFFKGHKERTLINVIRGQKWNVILGMPWLACHNPEIDWKTREVQMMRCPEECKKKWRIGWQKQKEREEKREGVRRPKTDKEIAIARIVAEKEEELEKEKEVIDLRATEEIVLRQFHKYLKMFEKKKSERMPMRKAWDHAIDLRESFVPKKGRIYLLSRVEKEKVQEFVKDQLRKGYIRLSKSPQTSPVFFVPKKDGKKKMVQDYWYLNSWTVKNNYLLPLILELIDSIGKKKIFTEMDLRLGYNNVRIKEGDEWKTAFSTPERSFEPTVMFFRLTNSPAMFQAMINDLLRNLVIEEKVAVFIDNMMIVMETEEGHDEIVEEVLRRLEENDLFVKLEKCMWKIREVGFLRVIIGEDRVRMEKEKVQEVIEWPVPKSMKDVQKFWGLANYYRRFIKDFVKIARLLHEMTREKTK